MAVVCHAEEGRVGEGTALEKDGTRGGLWRMREGVVGSECVSISFQAFEVQRYDAACCCLRRNFD